VEVKLTNLGHVQTQWPESCASRRSTDLIELANNSKKIRGSPTKITAFVEACEEPLDILFLMGTLRLIVLI
jgi:hypothetical protein